MTIFLNTRSQIWVETAIYTLIGLTLIAIVLSVTIPQVNKLKDKSIVEQTAESLSSLDNQLIEIGTTAGNTRIIFFKFEKGSLEINSTHDKIIYTLDNTDLKFSEPGLDLKFGEISYRTEEFGNAYNVILSLDYEDVFKSKTTIRIKNRFHLNIITILIYSLSISTNIFFNSLLNKSPRPK